MSAMRRKGLFERGRRATAVVLAAVMTVPGILTAPAAVKAAGSAADREDSSIVYFVDCGDYNVNTVSEGDQLGTHNSVTDQIYKEDPVTGYKWGIDDTVSKPLVNGDSGTGGVSTDWTWPYEQNPAGADNLPKTSSNRYTKNQFEKGVTERHLDYKFELENGTYYVEVGCSDPWGVSRSPSVYLNHGKDGRVTLTEGLNIAGGETAAGNVEVKDGELTINLRGSGDENKAINVTYIMIKEAGDASMVQTDLSDITVKTRATGNLTLPTVGKAGSTITWKSGNTAVITNDGRVARPEAGQPDVEVTLTASVTYGKVTKTKDFIVTVPAKSDLMGMKELAISEVTVTDPYYANSLDKEIDYLLMLDADRLLAGFRETAGYAAKMPDAERKEYMKNKQRYPGGWEDALIGGHTLGHWLTAMAQACVNKGTSAEDKAALKSRLDYVIAALKDCQDKTAGTEYEGYLFGAKLVSTTDLDIQFDNVEKNLTNIGTQAWVPWYTMHKIQAGLICAYELTGSETAYTVAKKLGDWTVSRVSRWSDVTQNTVLGIEYGGMNDCLYDLYAIVKAKEGEAAAEKYAEAAHRFDETTLFERINKGTKNAVDGRHANTTIPKFLGALKRYMVLGDEKYLEYAETFWDYVRNHHSYITGGNSEWEHFGADDILDAERTNCNCETCNTYNMLKMTRQLFMITGDPKYTDYYENTLINAIMSSQNPETGMSMYFQPMAGGYQKVFGEPETKFWCCTGSGLENFTKLNDSVYYQKEKKLVVSQYLASVVTFEEGNMKLTQTGDLTKSETMTFTVHALAEGAVSGELRLRLPDWLAEDAQITIGGTPYPYETKDGYAVIPADQLSDGAKIGVTLPMKTAAYNLPDGENTYAFKYGPYVLSAKLGTSSQTQSTTGVNVSIPTTKAIPNDKVAIKSADTVKEYMEDIVSNLVKTEGKLEFHLKGTDNAFSFVPHYSQYKESYAIYWTYSVDEGARGSEAVIREKNAARVQDAVLEGARPGYGQDELGFEETGTKSTGSSNPCWRYANAGGSFQYDIKVTEEGDNYLLCAFAKEEDGKTMRITVGDAVIFAGKLDSTSKDAVNINLPASDAVSHYQMRLKIPADVVAANKKKSRMEGTEEKKAEEGFAFIPVRFSSNKEDEASGRIAVMLYMMRAYRTGNDLTEITSSTGKVTKDGNRYQLLVPYHKEAKAKFSIQDTGGYVMVDGSAIDEKEEKTLVTTGAETEIPVTVMAEDFETKKEYTLKVVYDYTGFAGEVKKSFVKGYTFDDTVADAIAVTKAFVPPAVKDPVYQFAEGKEGRALKLSGSYGMKLPGASGLGESYTISWWMKPDKIGSEFDPTFAAGTFSPECWLNATFDAKLWSKKDGAYIDTTPANVYKADQWQHVAVVVDGSAEGTAAGTVTGTLYQNGKEICRGNVAKGIMTNSGAELYFGVNAWDAYYQGALDEVMIFNKALSAAEVQGFAALAVKADELGSEGGNKEEDKTTPGQDPSGGGTGDTNEPPAAKVEASSVSVKAAGYTLAGNKLTLKKGRSVKLVAAVSPKKASQKVTYASSRKKVASVSRTGVVKAKKAGTAKITVKTVNGRKRVITVKVVKKDKVNRRLILSKKKLSLKKGRTAQIKIKKMTAGTTSRLTYRSGKKGVVSVDKYGAAKAKKKGTAVITVSCGKKKAKVKVTVK